MEEHRTPGAGWPRIAVGVDLVEVARVRSLLEDNPAAETELFTTREIRYCADKRNRYARLAARFAAKEAALKALGTGVGPGMRWTDVEVVNDPLGRPRLRLHGTAAQAAGAPGSWSAELSLTHTGDYAMAQAVLLLPPAADEPAVRRTATDEGSPCASI
ncbi:holo-ACP synthase [Streptomyces sp. NBS 14/10]|uniref:holo-ACP synthase n=1 Tax=Streptomyces sp. NBS 14/10 TaxID=1945643 RepID=UPI001C530C57|nr:holo-ACP synthase [Streptomyces sp. NBS 14/10]KAK1183256.1 holo-ACP synthase [Streptomyces sp. NBS 14/10]